MMDEIWKKGLIFGAYSVGSQLKRIEKKKEKSLVV